MYLIRPVSKSQWDAMEMRHDLNRELDPLISPHAGNRKISVLQTDGAALVRGAEAAAYADRSKEPRDYVAIRCDVRACVEVNRLAFRVLVDRYSRVDAPPCVSIKLMSSRSSDHVWVSIQLSEDDRDALVVHDLWPSRQTFLADDGAFSSLADAYAVNSWRPGQPIEESWQGFRTRAVAAGPLTDDDLGPDREIFSKLRQGLVAFGRNGLESVNALATEVDCLLTAEQRETRGLAVNELIAYQSPDCTVFSNDVVPEAYLTPAWVKQQARSFPELHLAQSEWEAQLESACALQDVASVSKLLSSSRVRETFAARHELISRRALLAALDCSPIREGLVNALIMGGVDADAMARLQVTRWELDVDKASTSGNVESLAVLLANAETRSKFPRRHEKACLRASIKAMDHGKGQLHDVLASGCVDAEATVRLRAKIERLSSRMTHWQLDVEHACNGSDVEALAVLLAAPDVREKFPARHEEISRLALVNAMELSPFDGKVVGALVRGGIGRAGVMRLNMTFWSTSVRKMTTAGNVLALRKFLMRTAKLDIPKTHVRAVLSSVVAELIRMGKLDRQTSKVLIQRGADVNAATDAGEAPLQ